MPQQERRREPRFGVRNAATVKTSFDASSELLALTENLSAHGVLLYVESLIPENQALKVILALKLAPTAQSLHLIYEGKVVRTQQNSTTGKVAVAVVCDHPATVS
jgi:PilZ domain